MKVLRDDLVLTVCGCNEEMKLVGVVKVILIIVIGEEMLLVGGILSIVLGMKEEREVSVGFMLEEGLW
ncbi:hypothetical protein [Staphylococcus auricularis]|uniref:hypothetical protein n=1 Tax=Staphylococcus auricularis TaxID=29379 RepID=UPI0012489E79|nr:hypothetical protein [Staphylococcus auricularis]